MSYTFKDIKEVFEDHLGDLKIDRNLLLRLKTFRLLWASKSSEYSEFLGGSLLGCNIIKFTLDDEAELMSDILEVDIESLRMDILVTKDINPKFIVSTNPVYQTLGYLMHSFRNSKLSKDVIEEAIQELYLIFAYKVISSIIVHWFKYPVDKRLALAVHERLTDRYLIKRFGTWQKVFEHRAKDVIEKDGLHYDRVKTYTSEESVRMLNDMQGRIKETIKNIFLVLLEVKEEGGSVGSDSLNAEFDENDGMNAVTERPDKYSKFVNSIVMQPSDFIKADLIHIVSKILPKLDIELLNTTLMYLSDNGWENPKKGRYIVDNIMEVSIEYLQTKDILNNYDSNVLDVLEILRGYWSSSKVKNKAIPKVKKELMTISFGATQKKTEWLLTTINLGVIIYIFLRGIAKNTYK